MFQVFQEALAAVSADRAASRPVPWFMFRGWLIRGGEFVGFFFFFYFFLYMQGNFLSKPGAERTPRVSPKPEVDNLPALSGCLL